MKEINENTTELKYEASFTRVSDESTYRGPSVIEINGKIFGYFERGDVELGREMRNAFGKPEEVNAFTNMLEQMAKNSEGDGNFKITFTKYIPKTK